MPTPVCVLLTFRVAVQIDHSMGGEVRRVQDNCEAPFCP